MKKVVLLGAYTLLSASAWSQELLYTAKYHVHKVVLSRLVSFDAGYVPVQSWKIDLLMVTGRSNVLIYNTTGNSTYRKAVGAPAYRLISLGKPTRDNYDGVVTETYLVGQYTGQIAPPAERISYPEQPYVMWDSTVSGTKSLNLMWLANEQNPQGRKYMLTFHCRPVE